MSWPAGTIVVCIRATDTEDFSPPLIKGAYYTVRQFIHGAISTENGAVHSAVYVNETRGPMSWNGTEIALGSTRFRIAESTHSEAGTVRQQEPVTA